MKTEERKRSVMVGLFVLISIIIFVTGVLILGGQQKRFERTINIKTVFDDVAGLKKGNNVWFSGVKVGTIREIGFYGRSQVEVTMRIERNVQKYIRKDSKVKMSSEGIIGSKILLIEGGTLETPEIEEGDVLEAIAPLNTEDMMVTLQKNNENLVEITQDFKSIASQLARGEGTVGALLSDSIMANHFKEVMANLERVSTNTVRASGALNLFASKLNTEGGLANEFLTDTVVFQQLKASVDQLQQTAATMSDLTGNLNEASKKLQETDNGIGMLLNDKDFSNQLKNTMGNLESSTEKLDENMEALQHNFLFRGFFRRKARDEQRENKNNNSAETEINTTN